MRGLKIQQYMSAPWEEVWQGFTLGHILSAVEENTELLLGVIMDTKPDGVGNK